MNDYYDGAGLALFGVLFFILTIFALAGYVLGSWFLMKIFDKAGVQGRWRAWVPVYNTMVFAKLGDLNPWLILIAIGAGPAAQLDPGDRAPHQHRGVGREHPRRVAGRPQAAERGGVGHPLLLPPDRVARHPRLRPLALEQRRAAGAVGEQWLPARQHHLGRASPYRPGRIPLRRPRRRAMALRRLPASPAGNAAPCRVRRAPDGVHHAARLFAPAGRLQRSARRVQPAAGSARRVQPAACFARRVHPAAGSPRAARRLRCSLCCGLCA